MYDQIRGAQVSVAKQYHTNLCNTTSLKEEEYEKIREKTFKFLDAQYEASKTMKVSLQSLMDDNSKGNKFMTR